MNTYILCLTALLSADPAADQNASLYRFSPALEAAVRGQSPTYDDPFYSTQPGMVSPPANGGMGYQEWGAPAADPYFTPGAAAPYGAPPQSDPYSFGIFGPQPFKYGWSTRIDGFWMPSEPVDPEFGPPLGEFGISGVDAEIEYTAPTRSGWIFSNAPNVGWRHWDGPAGLGLPSDVYHLGWRFELATPPAGPWSTQFVFDPSLNTDFEQNETSQAFNLDGFARVFYRASPEWMFALGAGFWDRVNDRWIPYAGVVWTPNDDWEFRLLFPESRISLFLGHFWGCVNWLYVDARYHVEAYQIELQQPGFPVTQVEIEDWRAVIGLRSEHGIHTKFIEAGWVFSRDVEFRRIAPDFRISDGLIVRAGIRW